MTAQKPIPLLDDSLEISIFYEAKDHDLIDNICVKVIESCAEEVKVFKHDESYLFLTCEQAASLAQALLRAAEKSKSAASGV